RDDLVADGGLDRDVVELLRDELAELRRQPPAHVVGLVAVDDRRERVHGIAVEEDVELDEVARALADDLVVERGIASADGLQAVVEVEDDLAEGELVLEVHALGVEVVRVDVRPAAVLAERHQRADVLGRGDDLGLDVGLADLGDLADGRHLARVRDFELRPVRQLDRVADVRERGDDVEVELAVEALLDDLHVEHAEEADAEAEAERSAGLGLVGERGVVELELVERGAEVLEVAGVRRVDAGEDHRLDLAEAGHRLGRGALRVRDRVADARVADVLDAADDVADLAGPERL